MAAPCMCVVLFFSVYGPKNTELSVHSLQRSFPIYDILIFFWRYLQENREIAKLKSRFFVSKILVGMYRTRKISKTFYSLSRKHHMKIFNAILPTGPKIHTILANFQILIDRIASEWLIIVVSVGIIKMPTWLVTSHVGILIIPTETTLWSAIGSYPID